ncbi:putative bifunctional diguanylate cyclase/phosphodiesterase [Acidiphilium sp.]|uniref:putative bifunctional diguanylate cyclase/phosphodiesterase n=1 Tax=Acidiphilium sp. TaxID=527 RepID=UPI003CFD4BA8
MPIITGTVVIIVLNYKFEVWPIVVCFLGYSFLAISSIFYVNRRLFERNIGSIRLAQTTETIRILLRDFEENASDWLWETDASGQIKQVSARFAEVARRPVEAIGGDLFTFMAGADETLRRPSVAAGDAFEAMRRQMAARKPFRDLVVPVSMGSERRWWSMTGKPIEDRRGNFIGYRGVGSDVTAMHRSRERIAHLARHDSLTDLANRTEFNNTLSQWLSDDRQPGAALLCLDLDQFKAVNDSYGHGMGDSVLRAVAHRIRGAIRDRDVAARLGGDEFSIVLPSDDEFEATSVAERVIDRVARPYKFDGVTVEIGVSIGIALAPRDGTTAEDLYKNADLALYRAKDSGRGTWRLFDRTMDRHLQDRRGLQRDMKRALRDDQLFVEFQPVIALASSSIVGLEALVRWRHPERGIIPPGDFIEIAERSGLISTVTAFVLAEATALAAKLPPAITVAVNLSPLHLREAWLVDQLHAIIEAAGVTPARIEFEVTESAVLETEGRTIEHLHGLRALGCRIAIDDFGTGYSSLATLRRFPFDRLKIDRSFINDLACNENDAPIVKAIIELSHTLGLRVTAEGIETERHAAVLKSYGCNDGQGYLFSPPVRADKILDLFETGRTVTSFTVGRGAPAEPMRASGRATLRVLPEP